MERQEFAVEDYILSAGKAYLPVPGESHVPGIRYTGYDGLYVLGIYRLRIVTRKAQHDGYVRIVSAPCHGKGTVKRDTYSFRAGENAFFLQATQKTLRSPPGAEGMRTRRAYAYLEYIENAYLFHSSYFTGIACLIFISDK